MLDSLKACFSDTMESLVMKIFFYTGLFNWLIILAVFVINGTVTLELVRKMRKMMFYSFLIVAVPFIAAVYKYLQSH
jgi:hypothetical protein